MNDTSTLCDVSYFKKQPLHTQKVLLEGLKEINKQELCDKPYRISLIESNIPYKSKSIAMKKVSLLTSMEPDSGEYFKIKQWVDGFMNIPFNRFSTLPIHIGDGIDKCQNFMENAKKQLDDAVYGLDDAKMQIMQMLGQWISNPNSVGTAIAIHGPMGTGKTSIVKDGLSKIINRPFAFIPLGGATDSAFLEGHSYTYEGSVWGKIVDVLIQSKSMNPVFYFDELDKVSNTPKGDEIIGILTHLTDTTQNTQFHDKYFSTIDFDLSKALFIFSYNYEDKVNPILKDRMYRIETKGYTPKEKLVISRKYVIPKIEKNIGFDKGKIIISDEIINDLIHNYCDNEQGVRNLKRCLELIYKKINLYRLMKDDSSIFENEKNTKIEFPFVLEQHMLSQLVKKNESNQGWKNLYI